MAIKRKQLGAASDDPIYLANRAIREAEGALKAKDEVGFRQAAEKGWLAVAASADVTADRMSWPSSKGHEGRRKTLANLERKARLRRGTLVGTYEAARTTLHGECFHEAKCSAEGVLGILDDIKVMTTETYEAIEKAKRRRK